MDLILTRIQRDLDSDDQRDKRLSDLERGRSAVGAVAAFVAFIISVAIPLLMELFKSP